MPPLTMSQDAFRDTLLNAKNEQGTTFIAAAFITLEQYQKQAYADAPSPPACARHCSLCCYQMVSIYPSEWDHILFLLKSKHRLERKKWRARLQKVSAQWKRYLREKKQSIASLLAKNPRDIVRAVAVDWRGKPCAFLEMDGSCGIYEARPLPCRITSSPTRCANPENIYDGNHALQGRYEAESWASRIVNQWHEARGEFVAPFHYFITRDIGSIKKL